MKGKRVGREWEEKGDLRVIRGDGDREGRRGRRIGGVNRRGEAGGRKRKTNDENQNE